MVSPNPTIEPSTSFLILLLPGVTVVSPRLGPDGWPFGDVDPFPGAEQDPFYGAKHIKDIYFRADPNFAGRFVFLNISSVFFANDILLLDSRFQFSGIRNWKQL